MPQRRKKSDSGCQLLLVPSKKGQDAPLTIATVKCIPCKKTAKKHRKTLGKNYREPGTIDPYVPGPSQLSGLFHGMELVFCCWVFASDTSPVVSQPHNAIAMQIPDKAAGTAF